MNYKGYKVDKVRDEILKYYRPDGLDLGGRSLGSVIRRGGIVDDIGMRGSVANYFDNCRFKFLGYDEDAAMIVNGIDYDKLEGAAKFFFTNIDAMVRASIVTKVENGSWDWEVMKYRYRVLCQRKRVYR